MHRVSLAALLAVLAAFLGCFPPPRQAPPPPSEEESRRHLQALTQVLSDANAKLGRKVFARVNVNGRDATVTVTEEWRLGMTREAREYAAKALWKKWADLCSPSQPDEATLVVADGNGHSVGQVTAVGDSVTWRE